MSVLTVSTLRLYCLYLPIAGTAMELAAILISATQVLVFIGVSQHTWLYTLYKFHLLKIAKLFIYRIAFDKIIFSIISYSLIKRIKNRTFS